MKLVHASIDENGHIHGGKAGDQTSKEVCVRTWYSKPWNVMLRYKDSKIAEKAMKAAVKLANSNLVGYDQYQRNSLYAQLKVNNWDVDAYIKSGVKTEADCSSFMYDCYCIYVQSMRGQTNAPTTSTMRSFYKRHGFTAHTDSKMLKGTGLKAGDVVVSEGHHTAMIVDSTESETTPKYYEKYTGESMKIDEVFKAIKVPSKYIGNKKNRTPISVANGQTNYDGTYEQNIELINLAKKGKLKKA